ncbi:MAG TPA: glycosyltransferase family 39 protein [Candidatus Angelobacter sp.]|nr:glycosyltransferase family 39 protein [Candidatus Angelobacter sp.]
MGKIDITELFIYRWRYVIGYSLVAIGLIAVLIFISLYLPGGISNQEIQSVIKSASIDSTNLESLAIANLPYHLLQQASLALFGVSIISIKLPSIILAFLSAVGLVLLLRHWFKPNIGVLASLIAITTSQFLFIAQDGTPAVLYLFWSVWLILFASLISRQPRFRTLSKIAFFVMAALSLYTPLSIYTLIAIASAIVLHPHLRYLIRQLSTLRIAMSATIALLLLTPLIIAVIKTPSLGLILLGIPTQWPDFGVNLSSLVSQYLSFAAPSGMTIMTPFFSLGSMLIITIGAYQVARTRETAKSYMIMLWVLCLIPIIILNPSFISITFLPLVLLLASGLSLLLSHWYELFPRNPYARIGGLIPLVILVVALVFSGVNRYIYGYIYDPNIVPNFSQDLKLIPTDTRNIVVADSELEFYKVIALYNKKLTVSTSPESDTFLSTREAKKVFKGYKIDRIITVSNYDQSDRFYLYKK